LEGGLAIMRESCCCQQLWKALSFLKM